MDTNSKQKELFYPELSYVITGILFSVHNELGQYAREKQYGDAIENKFKGAKLAFQREVEISNSGNILDFIVDNKVVLELKAKRIITKDDYNQTQRYLQETRLKLGILINFRDKYIKPIRIVRIDTTNAEHYKPH